MRQKRSQSSAFTDSECKNYKHHTRQDYYSLSMIISKYSQTYALMSEVVVNILLLSNDQDIQKNSLSRSRK